MKRILFSLAVLLFVSLNVSAQKEVFFSETPRDSVSISGLQGIYMGPAAFHGGSGVAFDLGYLNELKLSNTISLMLGSNLYYSKYVKSIIYPDQGTNDNYHYYQPLYIYGNGIGLSAFAEPRWYFTYVNRAMKGKNLKLNTGWFLGLPLEMNTSILNAVSTPFRIELQLVPVIGYRYGFSNHFLLEASTGVGISLTDLPRFQPCSYLRIKAAYTFK